MKLTEFNYTLPERLIAHFPTEQRSGSRLLSLGRHSGSIEHLQFTSLPSLLQPGDLLVFNDTRVIPARLYGFKESGGKIEALVERVQSEHSLVAQIRSSKAPKPGSLLYFGEAQNPSQAVQVVGSENGFVTLQFEEAVADVLERYGHMPLPPYIKREDQHSDHERYQTVYARNKGAVAAPTAGLHFDEALLASLDELGVDSAFVTLHVGAGTFQPIRVEDPTEHTMHSEWLQVSKQVCQKIQKCKTTGGRVIAVGTTTVRSLETAAQQTNRSTEASIIQPYSGETDIFIYPGFDFKVVDAMVTNFHLPESTLLMLISAFAGREAVLNAYHEAVTEEYRFFSYGDAMFIG